MLLAARSDRRAVRADHDLDAAVQLPAARIVVARDRVLLAVTLGRDARTVDAAREQRRFDRVGAVQGELLVVRIGAHAVGETVDLDATIGMILQELRELIELPGRTGLELRLAGVEQHVAEREYETARGLRRLELLEFSLKLGGLLRGEGRLLRGRCGLLRGLVALVDRDRGGLLGLIGRARLRLEQDPIAFGRAGGDARVVGLARGAFLREARGLRGEIRGLIDLVHLALVGGRLRDAEFLLRGRKIERGILRHVRIRLGRAHGLLRGFQSRIGLGTGRAGGQRERDSGAGDQFDVHCVSTSIGIRVLHRRLPQGLEARVELCGRLRGLLLRGRRLGELGVDIGLLGELRRRHLVVVGRGRLRAGELVARRREFDGRVFRRAILLGTLQ
jgi:hypothetical protein